MRNTIDCIIIGYKQDTISSKRQITASGTESAQKYSKLMCFKYKDQDFYLHDFLTFLRMGEMPYNIEAEYKKNYLTVNEIPTLAPLYLCSFLQRQSIRTEVINLFDCEKSKLIGLLERNPISIAITTTFYTSFLPIVEIVRFIRSYNKKTKIIVGGAFIHTCSLTLSKEKFDQTLKLINADYYLVEFQGEASLALLLNALKCDQSNANIKNVVSLKGTVLEYHGIEREKNDMDKNAIDWFMLDSENLGATLNVRTARGCACHCSFCNHPVRAGGLFPSKVETIERELKQIQEIGKTKNIVFVDDTFNIPVKRFQEICRMMIRNNFNFRWYSYFRIDKMDEETVRLMKDSGCHGLFLGIESGDNSILLNMNKNAKIEDYQYGIELLNKYGIFSYGNFIIGFPGESEETVQNTIYFIKNSGLTFFNANLWYADVSTPIYEKKDFYKIAGERFNWSHATMDNNRAYELIEQMLLKIKNPVWLPSENFGFWSLPYLIGKEFTLEQVKEILINNAQIMEIDLKMPDNHEDAKVPYVNNLKKILGIGGLRDAATNRCEI